MADEELDRELERRLRRYESHIPAGDVPDAAARLRQAARRRTIIAALPVVLAAVLVPVITSTFSAGSGNGEPAPMTSGGSPGDTFAPATRAALGSPGASAPQSPPAGIPSMRGNDGSPGTIVAWCWEGDCGEVPIDVDHSERYPSIGNVARTDVTVADVEAEALASDDERISLDVTHDGSEISVLPWPSGDWRIILVRATFPSGEEVTYAWRAVSVITGADANHVAVVEPLVEVLPPKNDEDAELAYRFDGWDEPLGIEGATFFLKATDGAGNVVLDRMVAGGGDLETLPAGDYTLTAYYRPCDRNCSLLDPGHDFCSLEVSLEANRRHRLTVSPGAQPCSFR